MARPKVTPARQWTDEEKEMTRQHFERCRQLGPILEGLAFWEAP